MNSAERMRTRKSNELGTIVHFDERFTFELNIVCIVLDKMSLV